MNIDRILHLLARDPAAEVNLAEVALDLARDEYPGLDRSGYLAQVRHLATELRQRLRGDLTDRVEALSTLLFDEEGFRGDGDRYYDPENSYFNRVMDRRLGLPITLSILAVAVGTQAGIHVEGVGLPGHFIARAVAGHEVVLFDPFYGGRIRSVSECEVVVAQATGEPYDATPDDLAATPPAAIVRRLLTNLKGVYLRQGDFPRAVRVIQRILQLEPGNAFERRDLGVCLVKSGRPGAAIDYLQSFLEAAPPANEAEPVRQILRQARAEVARWN